MNICAQDFVQACFHFSRVEVQRQNCWVMRQSASWEAASLFWTMAVLSCSPTNNRHLRVPVSPYPHQHCYGLFYVGQPRGPPCSFDLHFPANDAQHFLMCSLDNLYYLLWINVYSKPLPIVICLSFCYWVCVLIYAVYRIPIRRYLQTFSLILYTAFWLYLWYSSKIHLPDQRITVNESTWSWIYLFFSSFYAFAVIPEKPLHKPREQVDASPVQLQRFISTKCSQSNHHDSLWTAVHSFSTWVAENQELYLNFLILILCD